MKIWMGHLTQSYFVKIQLRKDPSTQYPFRILTQGTPTPNTTRHFRKEKLKFELRVTILDCCNNLNSLQKFWVVLGRELLILHKLRILASYLKIRHDSEFAKF